MKKCTHKFRPALSIIDVMVFVVIIAIAVIGSSGYRYFSTLEIRKSDNEIAAGRIASLLCESWRGLGGASTYNPITDCNDLGFGFNITEDSQALAPVVPLNFTPLGYYRVISDNHTYYVTMSYYNIDSSLLALNVGIAWPASESSQINDAATNKLLRLSALITH